MTRIEVRLLSRGLAAALTAGLIGAILLTAPAQAERVSLNSLAGDHDDIQDTQNHGAKPISACGTIDTPGAHAVVENLNAVGDCLVVTVDHVSIDLGGHVLTGDGTGAGITSNSSDDFHRRDIAVRNGTLTGFSNGVFLLFYESIVIEGVRAVDNLDNGFDLSESVFGTIAGNVALDNGRNGIAGLSFGAIMHNNVANSGTDGIGGGGDNRVAGNTVTNSGRFGISTIGGTVAGNEVYRSAFDGIRALSAGVVTGNTSLQNGGEGIFVQKGLVAGNTAQRNGEEGIRAVCPSNVIGNTALNNTGANLVLSGAGCNDVNNLAP